tara:strand:- start:55 stop:1560 length:1506 start_codon:yes stop_codon:yes gene_type:complete
MAQVKTVKIELDAEEALKRLDAIEKELGDITKASQKTAQGTSSLATGFKGIGLAWKAIGIGAVIGALQFLADKFSANQKILDSFNIGIAVFGDVLNKIGKVIVSVVKGIGLLGKAVGKVLKGEFKEAGDLAAESFNGVKDAVVGNNKSLKDFIKNAKESAKETVRFAKELVRLRNEVKLAEANQRQLQLVYQKDAELQRQIRDDISLTFEERIAANQELGRILDEQFAKEQALAQKKVALAELELSRNKDNIDLQVALIDAKTELADLDERITGQRSEQLTNLKALEQEQADEVQAELEAKQKQLDAEEAARQKELALAQEQADKLKAIEDQKAADLLAIQKAREDASRAMIVSSGKDILSSVGQLAGEGTKTAKAAALAGILIDTARGISGAIAAGAGVPFPANLGAIFSGVATVLAGIAQAKSVFAKVPGGGGGGGGSDVSMPSPSQASAGGIGPLVPNMEAVDQPTVGGDTTVQAYVVENDISNSQALQQELDTQATL